MCQEYFTGAGYIVKTQNFHRCGRSGFFYSSALVVNHGTYFTVACACGNKVTHMQGTLLYQNGGNGTASLIQLGLDNKTSCLSVRISF